MAISNPAFIPSRRMYPHDPIYVMERRLGIRFQNPNLLKTALTHSSYLNEKPDENLECNERLEFLGDAILGSVIAEELYMRFPDEQEGALTSMRANIVQGETLAQAARRLDLGSHLLMGAGETGTGGPSRDSNLAAAFEAVVGAIFLDQDYDAARAFCLRVLNEEISSSRPAASPRHPKSELQELVQGRQLPTPRYRIIEMSGEPHAPTFTAEVLVDGAALGSGSGRSKSLAEQEAARAALEVLAESA